MNLTKYYCYSLTCPYTCESEEEREKHEQEHEIKTYETSKKN